MSDTYATEEQATAYYGLLKARYDKVEAFIKMLVGTDSLMIFGEDHSARHRLQRIFMNGNCGNFALALCIAFDGTPYICEEPNHVFAKIGSRYYDVTGEVEVSDLDLTKSSFAEVIERDFCDNYSAVDDGPII
jgi:hypothetical protein